MTLCPDCGIILPPCRVRRQWPAGGGLPERVRPDGALRPGGGDHVSPGAAEEKPISRGRP